MVGGEFRFSFYSITFDSNSFAKPIGISKLEEGDIIFHESLSEQATAIKLATKSRYTHVGIIFKYGNTYKVLEAVEPVKLTDLNSFITQRNKGSVCDQTHSQFKTSLKS